MRVKPHNVSVEKSVVAGCLMMLWATAWAQKTENPSGQTSSQQSQIAPLQRENPASQTGGQIPNQQPSPVQPSGVAPQQTQPFPRLVENTGVPQLQQRSAVSATTAPVTTSAVNPMMPVPAPSAPLGSELRSKIKEDEQHFHEQSAAAKREFDLRQAEERKEFEATSADKGFWERRRLMRQFRADQTKRRQEFNEAQEKKRRTYEWRYP